MLVNLFEDIKEIIGSIIKSRLTMMILVFGIMFSILLQRIFVLQIVNGESYEENFTLKLKKEQTLTSTRGNIYDRNGNLLAYNELAYEVTIEDNGSYDTTDEKNQKLNVEINTIIHYIEENGDSIVNDFDIVINDSGQYEYSVDGTSLERFKADVYGKAKFADLTEVQQNIAASEMMEYLRSSQDGYDISSDDYTDEEALKIVTVRYAMSANSFQKYITTTIASDVSEETVAVIQENQCDLQGVDIEESSIRKYVDSLYFSHIIGYTGKVSSDELEELQTEDDSYDANDVVGKSGIEQYMETALQGEKGSETVYVDNVGNILETAERTEPSAGDDVYLTIDKDLQEAVYQIIEQKLAGILVDKIINADTFTLSASESASDIMIPIADVYYALIDNNVISIEHFYAEDASDTEKSVYQNFLVKQSSVFSTIQAELTSSAPTPYESLSEEMQVYMTNIASLLQSNQVLDVDAIDTDDETYQAWKNETISLKEYLQYAITQNWIDISAMNMESQYADSEEIYQALITYMIDSLKEDADFNKQLYKYMILEDSLTGTEVCTLLYDQGALTDSEDYSVLDDLAAKGAYTFLVDKIKNLEITPDQLALDPCSGSVVVTDSNTGEVLAMVTYPSYDNNKLANSVDSDYYNQLLNDQSLPLINRATQQKTAPGSTFKMVTSIAGLEEGIITPDTLIEDLGEFEKVDASNPPKCWYYPSSHGLENVVSALRDSCNYFFYEVGWRLSGGENYNNTLGLSVLQKYAEMFGLGDKSGVEITESEPQISTEDSIRSAIGQGTNNYTASQLARYVTAVANEGTVYNLSLLDKVTDSDGNLIEDYTPSVYNTLSDVSQSTWDAVQEGMREVVLEKEAFDDATVAVAGKTGTAQENKNRGNHALFIAFAPYEDPKIALSVQIAYGYSSTNAVEIGSDIIKYYLEDESEVLSGTAEVPESAAVTD